MIVLHKLVVNELQSRNGLHKPHLTDVPPRMRRAAQLLRLDFHLLMKEAVPAQQLLWLELPDEDELMFSLASEKKKAVRYPFLMARIGGLISIC